MSFACYSKPPCCPPTIVAPPLGCTNFAISRDDFSAISLQRDVHTGYQFVFLSRQKPLKQIDKKITELVKNILGGEAIVKEPTPYCKAVRYSKLSNDMGPCCMSIFGATNIRECGCPAFNRWDHPEVRDLFEKRVIIKVLDKVLSQADASGFSLNIAVFGSGFVGTETSLFIRLLKILNEGGYEGEINLILLDRDYADIVVNGSLSNFPKSQRENRSKALGAALADHVDSLALMQGKVSIYTFIATSDAYEALCRADANTRADLFIGSDIGTHPETFSAAKKLYHATKSCNRDKPTDTSDAIVLYAEGDSIKYWGHNPYNNDNDAVENAFEEYTQRPVCMNESDIEESADTADAEEQISTEATKVKELTDFNVALNQFSESAVEAYSAVFDQWNAALQMASYQPENLPYFAVALSEEVNRVAQLSNEIVRGLEDLKKTLGAN